ncbi:MAG: flagellar basal body rod protein FlgC [Clostridiales bacterium]|jgi:flagellar basal-body rod protein FlgC|nr:flagellar basal body rod protein FlgC [Clostridiales bacterium]
MSLFNGMNISSSGMTAQRLRMDTIAQNIANVNTTRDEEGNVYRRKTVVFQEKVNNSFDQVFAKQLGRPNGSGVKVVAIAEDEETAMNMVYDPSHPDADEDGYVTYPNVNTVTEMTNLIDASRAYEANVTAFNASKSLALKGLEVGK